MKKLVLSLIFSSILLAFPFISLAQIPHSKAADSITLSGYWQNFPNPAQTPLRLTDIPAGYKVVNIAFGDMNSDGSVSFTLQGPPYDTMQNGNDIFKEDIKAIKANGVKVILSLGGQNGYFSVNSTDAENNFVNSLSQLISTYGFDGLDYDFESGLSLANEDFLVDATQKLKQAFKAQGKTLYFSSAPETVDVYWATFSYGKYDKLIQNKLLDKVQVQMYNSGCMNGMNGSWCYNQGTVDFMVSQADSTIATWVQNKIYSSSDEASQVYSIGLPAEVQAAGGGYTDPSLLKKAIACLKDGASGNCGTYSPASHYSITNVMTWSINWDAKNGYAFEKAVVAASK